MTVGDNFKKLYPLLFFILLFISVFCLLVMYINIVYICEVVYNDSVFVLV